MRFGLDIVSMLRDYGRKAHGPGTRLEICAGWGCLVVEWFRDGVMLEQIIV